MKRSVYIKETVFREKIIAGAEIEDYEDVDSIFPVFDEAISKNVPISSINFKLTDLNSPKHISDAERSFMEKTIEDELLQKFKERKEARQNIKISFVYPKYEDMKKYDLTSLNKTSKKNSTQVEKFLEGVMLEIMANAENFNEEEQSDLSRYAGYVLCRDIISAHLKSQFGEGQEFLNEQKLEEMAKNVSVNLDMMEQQTKICEETFYEALKVNNTQSICEGIKDEERKLLEMAMFSNAEIKNYASFSEKTQSVILQFLNDMKHFNQIEDLMKELDNSKDFSNLKERFLSTTKQEGLKEIFSTHEPKYFGYKEIKNFFVKVVRAQKAVKGREKVIYSYKTRAEAPINHINTIKNDFTKHASLESKPSREYVLKIYGKEPKIDMPKLS